MRNDPGSRGTRPLSAVGQSGSRDHDEHLDLSARTDLLGVPHAVLEAFGSARARPRVVSAYTSLWGFRKVKPRPVLTTQVALDLRARGVSTVQLVWWWRRVRMNVTTGQYSVWGTERSLSPAATGVAEEEPGAAA